MEERRSATRLRVTLAVLSFVAIGLTPAPLFAQSTDFVIVNRTGATLYYLYASPSNADSWGEDLLGHAVLADQTSIRVRLRSSSASYDVRAVDANDNEYIVWNFRPAIDGRVVLATAAFVGARASAASAEAVSWVTIVNDTKYDIAGIVAVPASVADWARGEQLLSDGRIVQYGETVRVTIDTDRLGTFVYDLMLVDVDGDRYVKWDVNLEITTQVVFTLDDLDWQ